jgi:hypothetical protein
MHSPRFSKAILKLRLSDGSELHDWQQSLPGVAFAFG